MKVLTTPRSYGKTDPAVFEMLERAGLEVIRNTTGGILNKASIKDLLADCEGVIVGVDPMDARCRRGDWNEEYARANGIRIWCFDLVTDDDKVNTAHEIPATMAMLDVEP